MSNVQSKQVILRKIVFTALIVMSGAFLLVSEISAQEDEAGQTYSLSVHYSTGKVKRLDRVISHELIREEDITFMSVILKDGRRFLFTVNDRDFEFSKELSQIIETEAQARKNAEEVAK